MRRVAEVVGVPAAREAGAGGRLDRDDAHLAAAAQLRAEKREDDAGAADDHVRIVVGHLELRHRLLAHDGLVQQHVVEHRAERALGVVALRRDLDRLGDRDAERARMVGAPLEDRAAGLRLGRRRGDAARAVAGC
jgi:hypothetical protein